MDFDQTIEFDQNADHTTEYCRISHYCDFRKKVPELKFVEKKNFNQEYLYSRM